MAQSAMFNSFTAARRCKSSKMRFLPELERITATASSGSTADLFKQIAGAPLIRCDQVQWSFLGVSMAGWNAILSLGGALLITLLALRGTRG